MITLNTLNRLNKFPSLRFNKTVFNLIFITLIIFPSLLNAQNSIDTSSTESVTINYNINSYTDTIQPSDFRNNFSSNHSLNDFSRLRNYREEKERLKSVLQQYRYSFDMALNDYRVVMDDSMALDRVTRHLAKAGKDSVNICSIGRDQNTIKNILGMNTTVVNVNTDQKIPLTELTSAQDIIASKLSGLRVQVNRSRYLQANIKNVDNDIMNSIDALNTVSEKLNPEYQHQMFRKNISMIFSVLVGLIMAVFFGLIYFRSDKTIGKEMLGSTGLQFITLFVLITAIILFGILGILQSSELAAILSGISGYILGKGVQPTAGKDNGNVSQTAAVNQ
ncbi:MAG: hypothetical protein QM737_05855 [Ferruginibacter sp.]